MFVRAIATLLISICLINVSSKIDKDCTFEHERSSDSYSSGYISDTSSSLEDQGTDKSSDCDGENCSLHRCHFGHCTFLIGEARHLLPHFVNLAVYSENLSYTEISLPAHKIPPKA